MMDGGIDRAMFHYISVIEERVELSTWGTN